MRRGMNTYARIKKSFPNSGQIAVEYALAVVIVAGLGSGLFLFYQGFVQANLYGHAGESQNSLFRLANDYKAIGLERVVSMPTP